MASKFNLDKLSAISKLKLLKRYVLRILWLLIFREDEIQNTLDQHALSIQK